MMTPHIMFIFYIIVLCGVVVIPVMIIFDPPLSIDKGKPETTVKKICKTFISSVSLIFLLDWLYESFNYFTPFPEWTTIPLCLSYIVIPFVLWRENQ